MDSITDDPRFSQIHTDPRFRPMPKSKRKVKIDKRFDSLFKSEHFKTRTDIDKRGRPVIDVSKRNKHVMQRFYELSSDDSASESSESDNESDSEHPSDISENVITHEDTLKAKTAVSKISKLDKNSNKLENIKKKDHNNSILGVLEGPKKNKKRKLSNDATELIQTAKKSKKLIGKSISDDDDIPLGLEGKLYYISSHQFIQFCKI